LSNQSLFNTIYICYTFAVSSDSAITPAFPVCRFSFADGRRCAQPASAESNGLCYAHAHAAPRPLRPSDLARELTTPGDSLASAQQIHRFLAKLSIAYAQRLITRKDLHGYTNLCNVMLGCLRDIAKRDATKFASAKTSRKPTPVTRDDHDEKFHPPAYPTQGQ
jgi:hypothetical protein